jgi:hypothetical protein
MVLPKRILKLKRSKPSKEILVEQRGVHGALGGAIA